MDLRATLKRIPEYRNFVLRRSRFDEMESGRVSPFAKAQNLVKRDLRAERLEWFLGQPMSPFFSARYGVEALARYQRVSPWARAEAPGWRLNRLMRPLWSVVNAYAEAVAAKAAPVLATTEAP